MSNNQGDFSVFVPMLKVDEEQRLVYGVMAEEVVDNSGEVFDYASSKPHFEKWSEDSYNTSNGMSKGNVRTMHGKVAAGKLTDIAYDDAAKRIECVAKVVDDNEWNKVLEGVYTGFSIGGRYAKRWAEKSDSGESVQRYTAQPVEVSLVDKPCIPTATFQMIKSDGTVETRPLWKGYNPDQERDESGRFGSGGGSDATDHATESGWKDTPATGFVNGKGSAEEQIKREIASYERDSKKQGLEGGDRASRLRSIAENHERISNEHANVAGKWAAQGNYDSASRVMGSSKFQAELAGALREKASRLETANKSDGENEMNTEYTPTNDELLPVARELAKAENGTDSDWAQFLDAAREKLTKAFDPSTLKDEDEEDEEKCEMKDDAKGDAWPLEGEEREEALEGDAGSDGASSDAPMADEEKKEEDEEEDEEAAKADVAQVWKTTDGETFLKKADAVSHQKSLSAPHEPKLSDLIKTAKAEVDALTKADDDKGEYGDVKYADPGYQDDKKPRYPIDNEQHIRAAWNYISRESNANMYDADQVERIKGRVVSAWKEHIDDKGPPSAEKMAAFGDLSKAVESEEFLAKSLWDVKCMAGILQDVQCLQSCVERSSNSEIPAKLRDAAASLGTILITMVSDEVGNMASGERETPMMTLAAGVGDLEKSDAAESMAKVNAMEEENSLLKADLADAKAEISEAKDMLKSLMSDIERIKAMPMPSAPRTHVVEKSSDVSKPESTGPDLEKMTSSQLADLAIRMAQAAGKKVV